MLLIQFQAVHEGLERGSSLAVAALVGALGVVLLHEGVQVGLDFFDGVVELLPKGHLVKLILNGLMEPLHRSVGLGTPDPGAGVLDLVKAQEKLVGVAVLAKAEFWAVVGEHSMHPYAVAVEKGEHLVVEQVSGGQGRLLPIDFGKAHVAVGVDGRLLVDAANALDGAHVACVLGQEKPWMGTLHLAEALFFLLGRLQGLDLGFGEDLGVFRRPFLKALEALGPDREIMALPDAADAPGADLDTGFFISLATRVWPWVGNCKE